MPGALDAAIRRSGWDYGCGYSSCCGGGVTCENGDHHLVDLGHCRGDDVARSDLKIYGTESESTGLSRTHPQHASFRPGNGRFDHHLPEPSATFGEKGDSVKVSEVETLPAEVEMGLSMEIGFAQRPG